MSTGEIFEVDPSGNEGLKLPEAGDEVRLYLGDGLGRPGLVIGVDINDEPIYYEPPDETPAPLRRRHVTVFQNIWSAWGSLEAEGPEEPLDSPRVAEQSGVMYLPADPLAENRQGLRERSHELGRMGRVMGYALGHVPCRNTFPSSIGPTAPGGQRRCRPAGGPLPNAFPRPVGRRSSLIWMLSPLDGGKPTTESSGENRIPRE